MAQSGIAVPAFHAGYTTPNSEALMRLLSALFAGVTLALLAAAAADAAEIKIMAPRAVWTVLNVAGPEFERATGHKLDISVDLAADVVRRVKAGEAFDLAVAAPTQIDGLVKDGKLIADTRTDLTRSGIGVEVRKGAPKPDIGTVEAFKRAMLDAKSIGYLKTGTSGQMVAAMLARIGLTEAIKSKVTLPETDIVSEMVADGKIEIGMVNIAQVLTTPGVDLVGPLPPELQSYIVFSAGVSANSKAPDAARDLIKFLKSPAATAVMKAQGMEPG
jgi:molybdate transport system substrate-binding protein